MQQKAKKKDHEEDDEEDEVGKKVSKKAKISVKVKLLAMAKFILLNMHVLKQKGERRGN